jgi:hypothetical protein
MLSWKMPRFCADIVGAAVVILDPEREGLTKMGVRTQDAEQSNWDMRINFGL